MTVHQLHEPEPDPITGLMNLIPDLVELVAGVAGDMTVGQFLTAMEDMPVKDVIHALFNPGQ